MRRVAALVLLLLCSQQLCEGSVQHGAQQSKDGRHSLEVDNTGSVREANNPRRPSSQLLRREDAEDAVAQKSDKVRILNELLHQAERGNATTSFVPTIRTCDKLQATQGHASQYDVKAIDQMRSLVEVKKVFATLGVPIILKSSLLLGWRRSCLAMGGDVQAEVATFGSWLHAVGLQKLEQGFEIQGHSLDSEQCKVGLLNAGCQLQVVLRGLGRQANAARASVFVQVLFSAPPPAPGRLPGAFNLCNAEICGSDCGKCSLAYAVWGRYSMQKQDRFTPCPAPFQNFELLTWMNETFWAPSSVDLYLQSEYGEGWEAPEPQVHLHGACDRYFASAVTYSSYPSFVPGLPNGTDVLQAQRLAEKNEAARISKASEMDLALWRRSFPAASLASSPPWLYPREKRESAMTNLLAHMRIYSWAVQMLLFLAAFLIIFTQLLNGPEAVLNLKGLFRGIGTRQQVVLFVAYVTFATALSFLQQSGLELDFPVNSAILFAYLAKTLFGTAVVYLNDDDDEDAWPDWLNLFKWHRSDYGHAPVFVLTLLPGSLAALSDWLVLESLNDLDPLTFTLVARAKTMMVAVLWQASVQRKVSIVHWSALGIFASVSLLKWLELGPEFGSATSRGLFMAVGHVLLAAVGNIASQLLLRRLNVSEDVLSACLHFQGFLTLLGAVATPELLSYASLERLLANRSLSTSILCMVALGSVTDGRTPDAFIAQEELGNWAVIFFTAVVQQRFWGSATSGLSDVQLVLLALLALGIYSTGRFRYSKRKVVKAAPPRTSGDTEAPRKKLSAPPPAPPKTVPKAPSKQNAAAPKAVPKAKLSKPALVAKVKEVQDLAVARENVETKQVAAVTKRSAEKRAGSIKESLHRVPSKKLAGGEAKRAGKVKEVIDKIEGNEEKGARASKVKKTSPPVEIEQLEGIEDREDNGAGSVKETPPAVQIKKLAGSEETCASNVKESLPPVQIKKLAGSEEKSAISARERPPPVEIKKLSDALEPATLDCRGIVSISMTPEACELAEKQSA
eukprot:gb/GFBE01044416.1/.p1 GENE.gb/GFBE01044416.1/~~gb/GFBE01044416.1/.p1  ORF type:complete len:1020 (+),score=218.84 gb/GFBE01044416.1/:1-3060(+)